MKVEASMWFESPGAYAEVLTYRSITDVMEEFQSLVDTWNRFGGSKPVGVIYVSGQDYPLYALEVTDRGNARKVRA